MPTFVHYAALRVRVVPEDRDPSPAAKEAREKRVLEAAVLAEAGEGPCKPLNPEWDEEFMKILRSGQIWRADAARHRQGAARRQVAVRTKCWRGSLPSARSRPAATTGWSRNSMKRYPRLDRRHGDDGG